MAFGWRIAALVWLACPAVRAQVVVEVEPNSVKSEATLAVFAPPGGGLEGTTTGSVVLPGDVSITSVDVFRVRTAPLPPAIYRHSLTLNIGKGHPVPLPSIRGLNQTGTVGVGGVAGTNDVDVQAPSTAVFPACSWYGFGKQEEVYYRLAGNSNTTIAYSAYWQQTSVTPVVIAPVLDSTNPITIQTTGETSDDTELLLYDATFTPVPSALNDDEYQGATTQSRLTRLLAPGTYYLAVGFRGLASDQPAAADDDLVTGALTDFPDCVVARYVDQPRDWDFRIIASNGTHVQPTPPPSFVDPTLVNWFQFTTAPGAPIFPPPPANDACANAAFIGLSSSTIFGTLVGATNDAAAACDPGGTGSRDVWYRFTNPLAVTSVCRLTTCQGNATDVTLSAFAGCGFAELACNDDCTGGPCGAPRACLTLFLAAGQTVWIRVGDKALGGTTFGLTLSNGPFTPSHDSCATPMPMAAGFAAAIDNIGATTGPEGQSEVVCNFPGGSAIVQDLWYTWTSPYSGQAAVTTCGGLTSSGSAQDAKIAVYQGAGCPTGPALACNDDSLTCFPTQNTLTSFPAVCGETYTFQVGMSPNSPGPLLGAFGATTDGGTGCSSSTNIYCRGDGVGGSCPCGNHGTTWSGCASSAYSSGALLQGTGTANTTTNDTWVLTALNVSGPCLFFQGTTQSVPSFLGDGQLCTGGTIVRLGVAFPVTGVARLPNASAPTPLHVLGGVQIGSRYYQGWYRSSPALCGGGAFGLTQGLSVFWSP